GGDQEGGAGAPGPGGGAGGRRMTEREIPSENVSFISGVDPDVLVLEERLERILTTPIDPDATWALIRDRIGPKPHIVPLRTRRRTLRPLVLGVAAALLVSGVAFAGVPQKTGASGQPAGAGG